MLLPNLPPPTEGVKHQSSNVDAYISQHCLGKGSLYIAESRLSWAKDNCTDGLSLEYPHIAVHAVSRDLSSFQYPCLYLMLDIDIGIPGSQANGHHSDDEDGEDDEKEMTEIRFVPSDPTLIEPMYKALSECQLLHPDPEDDCDDEYGYDMANFEEVEEQPEEIEEEEEEEVVGNGQNGHAHEDVEMDQFEDAEPPDMEQ